MKKAFTLIELLVVIAIIAILAAILFPVFAQAKAAAKKAASVSNVKQLSLAGIMYANDYDDKFVGNIRDPRQPLENQGASWWLQLPPYIAKTQVQGNRFDPRNAAAAGGIFTDDSAQSNENLLFGANGNRLNYSPAGTIAEYDQRLLDNQAVVGGGPVMSAVSQPANTAWLGNNGRILTSGTDPDRCFLYRTSPWSAPARMLFWGLGSVGGAVSAEPNASGSDDPAVAVFNPKAAPLGAPNAVGGNVRRRALAFPHSNQVILGFMDGHVKSVAGGQVFASMRAARAAEIANGGASFTSMFDVEQP